MCEQDLLHMRGDEDQALEEIRRLFERYRACAQQPGRFEEDDEEAAELLDATAALPMR